MEATPLNRKIFQLTENKEFLGELIYKNWLLRKAEIRLPHSESYHITPFGLFKTGMVVTKNGMKTAHLKMNWRGKIIISFENGRIYTGKIRGILCNKYIFENQNGEILMQLQSKFHWRKCNYSFEIVSEKESPDILLILLGVYASNAFITTMGI